MSIRHYENLESNFDSFSLLGYVGRRETSYMWGPDCPYCKTRLTYPPFDKVFLPLYRNRNVSHCMRCGWWGFSETGDDCNTPFQSFFSAILQSFDLRAASTPVEILELELPRWIEKVGHLNPKRMEDLVGTILSKVWACEVLHLGYSRDGGTDLLALNGAYPLAIQVKRRASRDHRETVSSVREFLGAAMLSGYRRLMYVTTAEKFTKGAIDAAAQSKSNNLVSSFELVSMKEIRAFLPRVPNQNPWDFAVHRANERVCEVPNVPDPYSLIEPDLPF